MPSGRSKRFFKSISFRIALIFGATFSVAIALAFLLTYVEISYTLENSNHEVIQAKFQEASAILAQDGVSGLERFYANEKNRLVNAPFMVRVLGVKGESLFLKASIQRKDFAFSEFYAPKDPGSLVGWRSLEAIHDEDKFEILTNKLDRGLFLQIGQSSEGREAILDKFLTLFLLTGLLLFFVGGGLGLWGAMHVLRPMRALVDTMRGVEKGKLDTRVPLGETHDELRDLGTTFNHMLERIEKLIGVMRESLDNVAHDIRTPLTRIRVVAEDALKSNDPKAHRTALEDCAESATNISDLTDQLLSISEAEAGTMLLQKEDCPIAQLISDVVEVYDFVAQEKEIGIVIEPVSPELSWRLDRKRIKQALANLLDNAIKFSPRLTEVKISASSDGAELRLEVRDWGAGISPADLPHIWNRLYRGDKSRSTQGSGLGLSIVRAVVGAHGGTVAAASAETGTVFTLALPKS